MKILIYNIEELDKLNLESWNYPVVIMPSFTLSYSVVRSNTIREIERLVKEGLKRSPTSEVLLSDEDII